jgi:phosphopantothenoylcysteine synthetase/decarboxylase
LHIDLRDWADLLLIAPLSAHTLAKLATGLSDDTLSCVVRAWDFGHGVRPGKPLLLAPAMNTAMWQHPLTQPQLETIQGFWKKTNNDDESGVNVIAPQVKVNIPNERYRLIYLFLTTAHPKLLCFRPWLVEKSEMVHWQQWMIFYV